MAAKDTSPNGPMLPDGEPQAWRIQGRLISSLKETLTCPVCQDIFEEPRQLECGHSACLGCLKEMGCHSYEQPFRCPNCRQEFFGQFVAVQKNFTLSNVVKDFKENISETVLTYFSPIICIITLVV